MTNTQLADLYCSEKGSELNGADIDAIEDFARWLDQRCADEPEYERGVEVASIDELRATRIRQARALRNLLREYCAATKLEPWSGDWQCEQVVRDAVSLLGLNYGDKL